MKSFKNNAGSRQFVLANGAYPQLTAVQYGRLINVLPFTARGNTTNQRGVAVFRSGLHNSDQSWLFSILNLALYKGLPPEIEEIDSWTLVQTLDSIRSEDRLFRSTNSGISVNIPASSLSAVFPSTSQAEQTGKATWFIMNFSAASGSPTDRIFFVGTIGLPGSGADLELSEVDLVQGVNYQPPAYNLRFLPVGFDFET